MTEVTAVRLVLRKLDRYKNMDLAEQFKIFGLSNIHTFEPNISIIKLFNLIFNNAKPRVRYKRKASQYKKLKGCNINCI